MSFEDKRFCVYLHRRKDNNEIFYVGQGNVSRPFSRSNRNTRWRKIVSDVDYYVEIVKSNITKEEALFLEQVLVDQNKNTLVNRPGKCASRRNEMLFDVFDARFFVDESSPTGLRYKVDILAGKGKRFTLIPANTPAGGLSSGGYYSVEVNGISYMVHRIIYLLSAGSIDPNMSVDHVDRCKTNNALTNLRLVDSRTNSRNMSRKSTNTTGVNGVAEHRHRFVASISSNQNKKISKSFSKKKYGDTLSFQLACLWRKWQELANDYQTEAGCANHAKTLFESTMVFTNDFISQNRSVRSDNKTGVTGVRYCANRDRYISSIEQCNLSVSKSFSCKKYGKEQALQLALEWRKQKEKEYELNSDSTSKTANSG